MNRAGCGHLLVAAKMGAADRDQDQLYKFFAEQQKIWRAVSQQGREFRAADAAVPAPRPSD